MSILGTRVVRTEDPRLLTAGGTYVDDLRVPELLGAARATFIRSPVAHALITGLDPSAARAAPGVIAVFTAQDMDDLPPPPPDDGTGSEGAPVPMGGPWSEPLLARDRVRFAGEPVALVLTDEAAAQRDPHRHQPARGQGHRRGRHDRGRAGHPERDHRRGQPPRGAPHRHARYARPGLGRDQRGEGAQ